MSHDPNESDYGRYLDPVINGFDDPSYVSPPDPSFTFEADLDVTFEELLKKQILIANALQERICKPGEPLDVRDLKDLVTASSSLVSAVQRGGEALKSLETYRVFINIVVEFLKRRSDSTGEDLMAELRSVAQELRSVGVLDQVVRS